MYSSFYLSILIFYFGVFIIGCSDWAEEKVDTTLLHEENNLSADDLKYNDQTEKFFKEERIFLVATENQTQREFFESGALKEEISYLNGLKHGKRKSWYEGGQLYKEGEMVDDKWDGKYREWYPDGSPKLIGHYTEGKQDGEWLFFDKNGEVLPSLFYENGREVTRDLIKVFVD